MNVEVKNLTKKYRTRDQNRKVFLAVDNASLEISSGETVGLLGESGSGKSTLAEMIVGLEKPTSGCVLWDGEDLEYPLKGEMRKKIQILFQHPESAFNPSLSLIHSMTEPYKQCGKDSGEEAILKDIGEFGLHSEHLHRTPRELSGGELQRLALSRAQVMEPELLILDEPTSMLDVISQAQIIHYLMEYQKSHQTAYLFITHNEALAEQVCDVIYRMHEGKLYNHPKY